MNYGKNEMVEDIEATKQLLPCPFCGGRAVLEQTGKMQITVKCTSCIVKRVQKWLHFDYEWLKEKQIESWNKRYEKQEG